MLSPLTLAAVKAIIQPDIIGVMRHKVQQIKGQGNR
jgi:hypothetical protein